MYWSNSLFCEGDETKLFCRGAVPAMFGSGISSSSRARGSLMRPAGIWLPGNGSPVSGSMIARDRKLKSPFRSRAVGHDRLPGQARGSAGSLRRRRRGTSGCCSRSGRRGSRRTGSA